MSAMEMMFGQRRGCGQRMARGRRHHQRGFTLVELSVAVLIALFLLGGLLIIVQDNRRAFNGQSQAAQLQDGERLAMTIIADVIESAGYFPDPVSNNSAGMLPAGTSYTWNFASAGQSVVGSDSATAPGAKIVVRYATASGDGILNCSGASNTSGANQTYVSVFWVKLAAGGTPDQLICTMNGTDYPLVSGIHNLQVLYGVKTDFTVDDYSVDTYLNAAQMAAANWPNVTSVRITLSFNNPFYVAGVGGQPQYIQFQRVIGINNRGGVKT
jgi:type IV pilus assembly protein PilW